MTNLMTLAEVCELLRLSDDYVMRCVGDGRLRAHRIGRYTRFRAEDVEAFLASHVYEPRKKSSKRAAVRSSATVLLHPSRKDA